MSKELLNFSDKELQDELDMRKVERERVAKREKDKKRALLLKNSWTLRLIILLRRWNKGTFTKKLLDTEIDNLIKKVEW